MKREPLTDVEARFAKLRLDETEIQIIGLEAQAKIAQKEIDFGLPMRKANENLENVKENVKRMKKNLKFYQKQIRDGKEVIESKD